MQVIRVALFFFGIVFAVGCSSALPPEMKEQVRKNRPEVQPEYSTNAPQSSGRTARLNELLQIGTDADLLYRMCGEPDDMKCRGTRLIYETCEGSSRFEVAIRRGKIARIWY